jgi:hypothetical protein
MTAKVIVTALLAALFGFASLIKVVGLRQSLAIRDTSASSRCSGG